MRLDLERLFRQLFERGAEETSETIKKAYISSYHETKTKVVAFSASGYGLI
jgi:hypothetical protein